MKRLALIAVPLVIAGGALAYHLSTPADPAVHLGTPATQHTSGTIIVPGKETPAATLTVSAATTTVRRPAPLPSPMPAPVIYHYTPVAVTTPVYISTPYAAPSASCAPANASVTDSSFPATPGTSCH
jgi:hypothetical protein